jgi:hypothetical protein
VDSGLSRHEGKQTGYSSAMTQFARHKKAAHSARFFCE